MSEYYISTTVSDELYNDKIALLTFAHATYENETRDPYPPDGDTTAGHTLSGLRIVDKHGDVVATYDMAQGLIELKARNR